VIGRSGSSKIQLQYELLQLHRLFSGFQWSVEQRCESSHGDFEDEGCHIGSVIGHDSQLHAK
jgi:hypothetical protein